VEQNRTIISFLACFGFGDAAKFKQQDEQTRVIQEMRLLTLPNFSDKAYTYS
jgi:hypothetical protein